MKSLSKKLRGEFKKTKSSATSLFFDCFVFKSNHGWLGIGKKLKDLSLFFLSEIYFVEAAKS